MKIKSVESSGKSMLNGDKRDSRMQPGGQGQKGKGAKQQEGRRERRENSLETGERERVEKRSDQWWPVLKSGQLGLAGKGKVG